MTRHARAVLDDCRIALQLLEEEKDLSRWRVHWAAALALVRAVGHVLRNVDSESTAIRQAAELAHKRWKSSDPQHQIFRDFIELERNNLLKEYKFNLHPLEEVHVAVQIELPSAGPEAKLVADVFPIGDNIYRPLLEGYRESDDARDVLSDAIAWWENELSAIDQASSRSP